MTRGSGRAIRACIVSPYPTLREGLGRYTEQLLSALRELPGCDVLAVAFHSSNRPLPVDELVGFRSSLGVFLRIARFRPQVVHIQFTSMTYQKIGVLLLMLLLTLLGVRLVVTQHEFVPEPRPVKLRSIYEGVVGKMADLTIVMNDFALKQAAARGVPRSRIVLVPHGAQRHTRGFKGESKVKIGFTSDTFILLSFGYLSRHKGLEYAIEALKQMRKDEPSVHLVIAGGPHPASRSNNYLRSLKNLVEREGLAKNVTFTGHVPDERVDDLFQGADLVLLPHVSGTLSGVLCLAAGYGVPVVASSVGGIGEEVSKHQIGVVTPPGRADMLASAVLELLRNEKKRQFHAEKQRLLAERNSWQHVAEQHLHLYQQLVQDTLTVEEDR